MHYFPYRDHTPFRHIHRPYLTLSFPLRHVFDRQGSLLALCFR